MRRAKSNAPVTAPTFPGTIIVDTRENLSLKFNDIMPESNDNQESTLAIVSHIDDVLAGKEAPWRLANTLFCNGCHDKDLINIFSDHREGLTPQIEYILRGLRGQPYTFDAIPADVQDGGASPTAGPAAAVPLIIPTRRECLPQGDYSLAGFSGTAGGIWVERKSAADLYSTIGQNRERFERELERLQEAVSVKITHAIDGTVILEPPGCAAVFVEAELSSLHDNPPVHSKLTYRSMCRAVIAWQVRYPAVSWHFLPNRRTAEVWLVRLFHKWLREKQKVAKP